MNWINKIEDYLKGNLSDADYAAFESAMAENEELQKEVAVKKTSLEVLQLLSRDEKRQLMYEEIASLPKVAEKGKVIPLFLKVAAAAVLLIVALFWYANVNYRPVNLVQKVDYFLTPFDPSIAGTSSNFELFEQGTNAYFNDKNYRSAVDFFQKIPAPDTQYENAQLFLAASHFRLKEYEIAVKVYGSILEGNLSENLQREVEWNQLLAKIGAGKSGEAALDQVAKTPNRPYQQKAKKLKKEKESFWRYFVF